MNKIIKGIMITLISIPVALFLLYCLAILAYVMWNNYDNNQILRMNKFDQKLWIDAGIVDVNNAYKNWHHHSGRSTRGKMYYDLINNYLKKGMSKEEVFKLLGKPNYGLKYPNNKNREYCLEYEIGKCGSKAGRILSICFKDNRVIEIFHDSRNNDAEDFKIE